MFRLCLLLSFALLFACGDDRPPPGHQPEGGSGGAGGSGGSHSTGGTGGEEEPQPLDETPPTISLEAPEDGLTVEDPTIWLEGIASDETGVEELTLTNGARAIPIDYFPGREIRFRFVVELKEGENLLRLEARDKAGNQSHVERSVTYTNTPGRPPVIEFIRSEPEIAIQGREFTLYWRVTGTRPIELNIASMSSGWADVSRMDSITGIMTEPDHEVFLLDARNAAGRDVKQFLLGVGDEMRLWPTEATIPPGARQRIAAVNVGDVVWEADGGQIAAIPGQFGSNAGHFFKASEPGTYRLTATSSDPVPRTGTITIHVAEQQPRTVGYRGIGGQFGDVSGWRNPSPVLDVDGSLLLVHPRGQVYARYEPGADAWTFGNQEVDQLVLANDGTLYGRAGNVVLARGPGSGSMQVVSTGWESNRYARTIHAGLDGSTFAILYARRWDEPSELWTFSLEGPSVRRELPEGLDPQSVTTTAEGRIVVAATGSEQQLVVLIEDPEGGWTDLGTLPRPSDPFNALLVTRTGGIYVSGQTVMGFNGESWTDHSNGLPTCQQGTLCGVFALHERADGGLLAVGRSAVYDLGLDGVFRQVGEPSPWMQAGTQILGAMRAITEASDGTLYLVGDTGVFRLLPDAISWEMVGAAGMAPTNEAHDLIVEADGSWTLASGGWGGQQGSHSLYRKPAGSTVWEGYGGDLGRSGYPDSVLSIGRDGAGHLYGITVSDDVFRIDATTGRPQALPALERSGSGWEGPQLGVALDGTLYIAADEEVFRLLPGAERWTTERDLPCTSRFVRTADGSLWAADCFTPARLNRTTRKWEAVLTGLPIDLFSNLEAFDLSADERGDLFLASGKGVFRFKAGGRRWERVGHGEASISADRITSRGGRTWASSGGTVYELSENATWLPVSTALPMNRWYLSVFQAAADGSLLVSDGEGTTGLIQSVDRQP